MREMMLKGWMKNQVSNIGKDTVIMSKLRWVWIFYTSWSVPGPYSYYWFGSNAIAEFRIARGKFISLGNERVLCNNHFHWHWPLQDCRTCNSPSWYVGNTEPFTDTWRRVVDSDVSYMFHVSLVSKTRFCLVSNIMLFWGQVARHCA